ncbi:MAG: TIGR03790 family protein [Verrucomicrobiota bacterium]
MMRSPLLIGLAALFLFVFHLRKLDAAVPLTPATIVIYNSSIPESAELAKFYAQKRGIARDHLVGLVCSKEEEISREDYDATIAQPLRKIFRERKWWTLRESADAAPSVTANSIRFVALIKGMPLKIRSAAEYPDDKPGPAPLGNRNEASVDSELALLPTFSHQISGALGNAYFQTYRSVMETDVPIMLVCRLDAAAAATVRRMIVDGIEAEKSGLWGRAYVDGAHNTGGGMEMGDQWLTGVVDQLRRAGVPVVYDNVPAIFPAEYPMTDCALYYGWYAAGVAGPFTQPAFKFLPGAIAVHIHSFSANTLRDANANWVAPLLNKGAAASLGNVYEPYLQLTPHLEIFNDRLLHGFTFAESAYMSVPALSWMTVMVGDPLYRPYAAWLQIDTKREPEKNSSAWKMYHDFATKNAALPTSEYRTLARQAASRTRNAAMIEDLGGMEAREGKFADAAGYFQQARALSPKRDDILRLVLEEADALIRQEQPKRALALVRGVLRIAPDAPAAALLKKIETDLSPPAITPTLTPGRPNE